MSSACQPWLLPHQANQHYSGDVMTVNRAVRHLPYLSEGGGRPVTATQKWNLLTLREGGSPELGVCLQAFVISGVFVCVFFFFCHGHEAT